MSKRKITNSQAKAIVELLSDDSHSAHHLRIELTKNIIPHLFEEKTKLEVGKWYKWIGRDYFLFCFQGEYGNTYETIKKNYGFDLNGKYTQALAVHSAEKYTEATEEEVKEALIKEAVKRGFTGKYFISPTGINEGFKSFCGKKLVNEGLQYNFNRNILETINGYGFVFDSGKWAEIIQTITKEAAEKELGKKIID